MLAHHGDKAIILSPAAGWDGAVLDYAGPQMVGCSLLWRMVYHEVRFTPEGALREVAAIIGQSKLLFGVSDSGEVAFAGQTATIPGIMLWGPRGTEANLSLE